TFEFAEMYSLKFEKGRYFSPSEYHYGAPKVILGHNTAAELFGTIEPVGKTVRLMGRKLQVIGIIEKAGESIIGFTNFDDLMILPFELAKKVANLESDNPFGNASLAVKAAAGVSNDELKDELTGVLRSHRRLKPREEDNFGLNEISIMQDAFQSIFDVLSIIGLIIGGFAILVGVFSVANIMFVSVKERTNIIGIKKALGAKRYVILMEFLIEAIILCLLGGLIGLLFVYGLTYAITAMDIGFAINLSTNNIISGLIWSTCIGLTAGFIPALRASGMDAVEAMRAK
ncbi:MAG: ABC transporter permease, partial [Saprospiraceae bacterium]